ncbi:helicase-related protein [Rhizorhapis suberifaciens]|uniref:ATP-dependent RNA helicase SUPV3L1/SUV3 n=1 Tax=Rhizorhapis suberifaciens TaxID=13656 RepID=A0A840HUR6_9SPHN|nr:helicase-related protein [Rhizorhapis suberifaciens]MBB4641329.1 ATP-dependent RNA helicase SUPV3L1/SUV3 [Rhizorhapis suberifaciens]
MASFARSSLTAVLGPTNTGKTHLAVERMCAHSSGMIGFPLRLLAREVYDRVVGIKGKDQVALITGEEKILPDKARWFLCTAESMPVDRDFAFVAVDEAQLGADPERGHVFTDRLLRARGREETMILGSDSLRPLVRALVPDAEIINRPRFSTLSYAGSKKLSRLPKRSAIVAFSVEEVYAVAEMLRRFRGGSAVVMGALSPHTRNRQVAMFQAGEVDYLVATDAIGMGLNMDVAHVAFASLSKFDGRRVRRLTVAEMAQIAGRAGRHQRDGTFGSLGGEGSEAAFTDEEIDRIENHRFPKLDFLYWREGEPPMDSVDALIAALEEKPARPELRGAPQVIDLSVLKRLADEPDVIARARGMAQVKRLWAVCGLPDFQKLGAEDHARTVLRLWRHLSEGNGHIPQDWFAQQIARLDTVEGDIDTLSARIAAARTWSYIAHRSDWLQSPAEMAERTRALEEKLSDALHERLTQRFVDRRTAVLLKEIGYGAGHLPVDVDESGSVHVDGESIGQLNGFRFSVAPDARHADRKMLLAAAERRLGTILGKRADELVAASDKDFALAAEEGEIPGICWKNIHVAALSAGPSLLDPLVRLDAGILTLSNERQRAIAARLAAWLEQQKDRHLGPLRSMTLGSRQPDTSPSLRAVLAQLAEEGGILPRVALDEALGHLDKAGRVQLRKAGIVIGSLDVFHAALLKPGAARWRLALLAVRQAKPMARTPKPGAALFVPDGSIGETGARLSGFRRFAGQYLRIDIVERLARLAHDKVEKREAFTPDDPQIISLGLQGDAFRQLMRSLGFRPAAEPLKDDANWAFRGRMRPVRRKQVTEGHHFSGLAQLLGRHG